MSNKAKSNDELVKEIVTAMQPTTVEEVLERDVRRHLTRLSPQAFGIIANAVEWEARRRAKRMMPPRMKRAARRLAATKETKDE